MSNKKLIFEFIEDGKHTCNLCIKENSRVQSISSHHIVVKMGIKKYKNLYLCPVHIIQLLSSLGATQSLIEFVEDFIVPHKDAKVKAFVKDEV